MTSKINTYEQKNQDITYFISFCIEQYKNTKNYKEIM